MFGFFFGTLCLFGLLGMARRAAYAHHYAYAGGCHGGHPGAFYGGHHGFYGGFGPGSRGRRGRGGAPGSDGFARAAGEVLKRRLRIDDEQEMIVDHALIDARKAVKTLGEELEGTRAGLAEAFAGEQVDDAALATAFAKHDDAVARARRELVSAMKQVHAVLDADQRKAAAALINQTAERGWWV